MTAVMQARFEQEARLTRVAGFALAAAMAFCTGIVFDAFADRLSPAWRAGYLPWASLLAALLGILSEGRVHNLPLFSGERFSHRFSETVVLVLILKAGYFISRGSEVFLAEIARYRTDLWGGFFSGDFLGLLLLSYFAWLFTVRMAGDLIDLSLDREILEEGARPNMTMDRNEVGIRMAGGALFFGALLIVIAALTRADIAALWRSAPPIERAASGVIGYFCLSLVLFSLNRFSILRARWGWERTPIGAGLSQSWLVYTALAIALVLVVAALLPTGYSLGLFETVAIVFRLAYTFIAYLVFLLMLPLLLLLASLNREPVRVMRNPFEDISPPPNPEAAAAGDPALWLEAIRSFLFWAAFLAVAGYALVQFVRQNRELWEKLKTAPILRNLLAAWRTFRRWFSRARKRSAEFVMAGLDRFRENARAGSSIRLPGLIGYHRLSPRERILFLYKRLLQRGGEAEIRRRPAQTPDEYATDLAGAFPGLHADIRGMTAAFEAARYGRREIRSVEAAEMKMRWDRVRPELQKGKSAP